MILYAESSAVLAWLNGENEGSRVQGLLVSAQSVAASDLTLLECDRVLIRAVASRSITEAEAAVRRAYLASAASRWNVFPIAKDVIDRSRRPFPAEPIRALDAIHLATALIARSVLPTLEILSLDARIRNSGHQLGFKLLPP